MTAVAKAVLKSLLEDGWIDNCRQMGAYFRERLEDLGNKHPTIKGVRGLGLILGIELDQPGMSIVDSCREKGFLINCIQENILRFVPPLIIGKQEIDLMVDALDKTLDEMKGKMVS
jgi:acetylornithine/N-succinyldiaminopimelate aminotransferase